MTANQHQQTYIFRVPAKDLHFDVRATWSNPQEQVFRRYLRDYGLRESRDVHNLDPKIIAALLCSLGYSRELQTLRGKNGDRIVDIIWHKAESKLQTLRRKINREEPGFWNEDLDTTDNSEESGESDKESDEDSAETEESAITEGSRDGEENEDAGSEANECIRDEEREETGEEEETGDWEETGDEEENTESEKSLDNTESNAIGMTGRDQGFQDEEGDVGSGTDGLNEYEEGMEENDIREEENVYYRQGSERIQSSEDQENHEGIYSHENSEEDVESDEYEDIEEVDTREDGQGVESDESPSSRVSAPALTMGSGMSQSSHTPFGTRGTAVATSNTHKEPLSKTKPVSMANKTSTSPHPEIIAESITIQPGKDTAERAMLHPRFSYPNPVTSVAPPQVEAADERFKQRTIGRASDVASDLRLHPAAPSTSETDMENAQVAGMRGTRRFVSRYLPLNLADYHRKEVASQPNEDMVEAERIVAGAVNDETTLAMLSPADDISRDVSAAEPAVKENQFSSPWKGKGKAVNVTDIAKPPTHVIMLDPKTHRIDPGSSRYVRSSTSRVHGITQVLSTGHRRF